MSTYIVESWQPSSSDGTAKVSCRIMERDYNPHVGRYEWRYGKTTLDAWDWELHHTENHKAGVIAHVKVTLQKDPVWVTHGGDTALGMLWIVETTR
jgi:hypothetical protein